MCYLLILMFFVQGILGMETELKRAHIIYNLAQSALEKKNPAQLNAVLKHLHPIIESELLAPDHKKKAQDLFDQITSIISVPLTGDSTSEVDRIGEQLALKKHELKKTLSSLETNRDAASLEAVGEAIDYYQELMEQDVVPQSEKEAWQPTYFQYKYLFAYHLSINNKAHEYDDTIMAQLAPLLEDLSLENFTKVKVKALSLIVDVLWKKDGCTEEERCLFKGYLECLLKQNICYAAKIDALIMLYALNDKVKSDIKDLQEQARSIDFFDALVDALCIPAQEYFKASKQTLVLPPEIIKQAVHLAGIRLDQLLGVLGDSRENPIEVGQQLLGDLSSMNSLFIANDTQEIKLGLIQRLLSASHTILQNGNSKIVETLLQFLEPTVNALSEKKTKEYALKIDYICFKEVFFDLKGADTRRLHALRAFEHFIISNQGRTAAENNYLINNYWNQARIFRKKRNIKKAKELINSCIKNAKGLEKLKSYLELGLILLDENNFKDVLKILTHAITQTNKHTYRNDQMMSVILSLYFGLPEASKELANSLALLLIAYAEYHFNHRRYGKSIEYASIVVDEMEENSLGLKARAILGFSKCVLHKYSEGLSYLQSIKKKLFSLEEPWNVRTLEMLLGSYVLVFQFAAAEELNDKIILRCPAALKTITVQLKQAMIYFARDRVEESVEIFERLVVESPDPLDVVRVSFYLHLCYQKIRSPKKANTFKELYNDGCHLLEDGDKALLCLFGYHSMVQHKQIMSDDDVILCKDLLCYLKKPEVRDQVSGSPAHRAYLTLLPALIYKKFGNQKKLNKFLDRIFNAHEISHDEVKAIFPKKQLVPASELDKKQLAQKRKLNRKLLPLAMKKNNGRVFQRKAYDTLKSGVNEPYEKFSELIERNAYALVG